MVEPLSPRFYINGWTFYLVFTKVFFMFSWHLLCLTWIMSIHHQRNGLWHINSVISKSMASKSWCRKLVQEPLLNGCYTRRSLLSKLNKHSCIDLSIFKVNTQIAQQEKLDIWILFIYVSKWKKMLLSLKHFGFLLVKSYMLIYMPIEE